MIADTVFREPTPVDEERLAILCGELGYPSSASDVAERLSHFAHHNDHLVLIATDDKNQPIAWVHAFVAHRVESDRFVELGGMVVSESHRDTGIGGQLLVKAEEWATAQGAQAVRVRSHIARERAHQFYLRAGYEHSKTSHLFQKTLPQT